MHILKWSVVLTLRFIDEGDSNTRKLADLVVQIEDGISYADRVIGVTFHFGRCGTVNKSAEQLLTDAASHPGRTEVTATAVDESTGKEQRTFFKFAIV